MLAGIPSAESAEGRVKTGEARNKVAASVGIGYTKRLSVKLLVASPVGW